MVKLILRSHTVTLIIFDFLTTGFFGCDQEILVILYTLKLELAQKMKSEQIFIMDVKYPFRRRE